MRKKLVAVIVAHPDDETLWAGGTLLTQHWWECFVVCLCRGHDPDRAPKFHSVLAYLGVAGTMADLDDGPEQTPLTNGVVEEAILNALPPLSYDLIITHSPRGEYTRHRRHEEIGRAVINLWNNQHVSTRALWLFAYEDGGREYLPRAIKNAPLTYQLDTDIWEKKHRIITDIYGFGKDSWEARTTPSSEAFWNFVDNGEALLWMLQGEK